VTTTPEAARLAEEAEKWALAHAKACGAKPFGIGAGAGMEWRLMVKAIDALAALSQPDTIPLSAIRPITVEAIREVTGCPDVLGAGGKSLVEAMESVAQAASKVLGSQPDEARDAPEQDPEMLEAMKESNKWHFVDDIVPVLKAARAGEWHWYENSRCKYIELRIDMRDLGCIIRDREKVRISPATLAYQYSKSDAIVRAAASLSPPDAAGNPAERPEGEKT
jgi:hypothetical protein